MNRTSLDITQLFPSQKTTTDQHLFTEVFPIRAEALPPLTAYHLLLRGDESSRRVGARLAEWLGSVFGGYWLWSSGRLITDNPPNPVKLLMAVDAARAEQKSFQNVESLEEDFQWHPSADEIADYVVKGPVAQLEETILEALSRTVYSIRSTRVQREYRLRTWVINDTPALSVSVVSRLLYEPDLQAYIDTIKEPSKVVGLWVTDKTSRAQGEVIKIVGLLDEHRERLLDLVQRGAMREIIEAAPGNHWVVRVLDGSRELDYVADALDLVVRPEDITTFAINEQQLEKALHLKPMLHAQMVKLVSDILKEAGLIGNSFSTQTAPEQFQSGAPQPNLTFANSRVRPHNPLKLPVDFKDSGAYHLPERFQSEPLRVVVINTLADDVGDFLEALKRSLDRDHKLKLEVVRERNMRVISQVNLESAVRLLQKEKSDLVVVFLPDESETDEDEAVNERVTRTQTVGRGLPCLLVHESTINDPSAMTSVIMGLIARVAAVPYLLADPLPYADRVVGLSLINHGKREGEYVTGISRIFSSDGRLLRAVVSGAPVEGGIPDELMARLFPRDLLHKQRVVIHSDGRLRRDAQRALGSIEDELDATFLPVEILRAGVPRVYALNAGKIDPPRWGSIFRLSDTEAFVQTTDATIQPLHIRAETPFTIDHAVHSVLLFTLFHYGAFRQPKLPITI
ncbi:MAG: hypothetical protein LC121_10240, partial [Anaerolineae bacterium]|nr:hypothetical protein [Anaerolineae bacterium]